MLISQTRSFFNQTRVQILSVFLGITLLRFWPVFFQQKTFFFAGDNYSLLVTGKLFTSYWLKQGIVPLWNSTIFSGISWVGDITQTLFYPSTLLFILLPAGIALSVTVISHLAIMFVGMYLLAKKLSRSHIAALLVASLLIISSQVTGAINNIAILQSISWLPCVLWAANRLSDGKFSFLKLSFFLILTLLAGYPQHMLLILPLAVLFSLPSIQQSDSKTWNWRRWLTQWSLTGLISLGLTAVVLWPFLETLLTSTRMIQSTDQATRGSMHPTELIKLFLPYFFNAPLFGMRWGPNWNLFPTDLFYIPWLGFVLIITRIKIILQGKMEIILLSILLLSLILSMGSFIPGFTWFFQQVPVLSAVRSPSTWLILSNILSLLLLSIILPKTKLSQKFMKYGIVSLILIVILSGISWLTVWLQPSWVWETLNKVTNQALENSPFHTQERDQLILLVILGNIFVNALFSSAALLAFKRKRITIAVTILILDAIVNAQAMLFFAPNQVYDLPQNQTLTSLLQDPSNRVLTRNYNEPYTDYSSYLSATVVRVPFSDSFIDTEELETGTNLMRLRDGLTSNWNSPVNVRLINGYTTMVPTSYYKQWNHEGEVRINALSLITLDHPQLQNWAVKYYVVDTWFTINEELPQSEPIYNDGNWRVYELPTLSRFRYANDEAVTFTQFTETPNDITFTFNNESDQTYLKIADRYESGWQAEVNEQKVRVENWDDLRAIPIAQGENEVILRYLPQSFVRGGLISIVTVIVLFAYSIVSKVRSIRKSRALSSQNNSLKTSEKSSQTNTLKTSEKFSQILTETKIHKSTQINIQKSTQKNKNRKKKK